MCGGSRAIELAYFDQNVIFFRLKCFEYGPLSNCSIWGEIQSYRAPDAGFTTVRETLEVLVGDVIAQSHCVIRFCTSQLLQCRSIICKSVNTVDIMLSSMDTMQSPFLHNTLAALFPSHSFCSFIWNEQATRRQNVTQ